MKIKSTYPFHDVGNNRCFYMTIKDYFVNGVYSIVIKKIEPSPRFVSLCKRGVGVEVIKINDSYFCNIYTLPDGINDTKYHIALVPIKPSLTLFEVCDLSLFILHDLGYLKSKKK